MVRLMRWVGALMVGGLMLAGCGAFEATPTPMVYDGPGMVAPTPAGGSPDTSGLAGTAWTLTGIDGATVEPGVGATLVFGTDGKVSGSGGCNSFGGDYSVSGSTIRFSAIASTLMACDDPKMGVEQQYLGALQGTVGFSLSGNALVISGAKGVRLTFAAA